MKIKCYSVRLRILKDISCKCFKAIAFDGSEALIPKSQVFGEDLEVIKSSSYWISAWILEQKNIQYSDKKIGWFNKNTMLIEKNFTKEITINVPEDKSNEVIVYNNELFK